MTKSETIRNLDTLLECIRKYDEMLDRIEDNAERHLAQVA